MNRYWMILLGALALLAVGCFGEEVPEEVIPPLVVEPVPDAADETLAALLAADPPQRDLADLAQRLKGVDVSAELPPKQNTVGDTETFWYLQNGTTNSEVSAELAYQSDLLNMWVETGVRYSDSDLQASATELETKIIPTNRAFFGDEPRPGIDGDNRINFLHLESLGGSSATSVIAGYFSAADLYPRAANQFSNEREMLYINLDVASFASEAYFEVVAHELEHLIQSNTDRNEESWKDEGLAELSAFVNGYEDIDSVNQYVNLTDVQLNDWSNGTNEDLPHYGASFLWSAYFLDRFGEEATKKAVANEANGFQGYQATLDEIGSGLSTDQLFADWSIANYLTSIGRSEAPYSYDRVDVADIRLFADHDSFPAENTGAVYQYGTDYVRIEADGPVTLDFEGSSQVDMLPTSPHSGEMFVSTFPADRSDMTLTRPIDLTATDAQTVTLNFWSWYQIEEGWDYGYVAVSADSGQSWTLLGNKVDFTQANPQGNNYGVGLTGESGFEDHAVWRELFVDLTPFKGEEILLRFEYVTDDAVFEAGWAIDDIRIDAIGYSEDFENGLGGWEAAGWVHHANTLRQTFLLNAIFIGNDSVRVEPLTLDPTQSGTFTLNLNSGESSIVLTISGSTPITKQRAAYNYEITQ